MKSRVLCGIAVSRGIAIGPIYKYLPPVYEVEVRHCMPEDAEEEAARFHAALHKAQAELDAIYASFDKHQQGQAMIFLAHKALLADEELLSAIIEGIHASHLAAESAVCGAVAEFAALLSAVGDPLIAARAADLIDVRNRLLRILLNKKEKNLSSLPGEVILAAHDLLPSDTATLDRAHVLGILTESGSSTSHSAIIAKSLGIPAVLGIEGLLGAVADGQLAVLDAMEGKAIPAPDEATLVEYTEKQQSYLARRENVQKYLAAPGVTKDGVPVKIGLNIGSDGPNEGYVHADFVGLFRTEFLYMESDRLPTEEEQFHAYKRVLKRAGGIPVTLRTLDIGGDKKLPYLPLPAEDNPFLGKRALRLCLDDEPLFCAQLRAAYRASAFGTLQIMFPMVGSIEDIRRAKAIARSVRDGLREEGVPLGHVPLGVMIEIPAIAMIAPLAAREVDFASIGTNDLCQYLCAADRMNPAVAPYYQSFSPAMLQTLKLIIDGFGAAGTPLSVCGEMGGDPRAAQILVGMGLRKLSMHGAAMAEVKAALASRSLAWMEKLADDALLCETEADVLTLIESRA